LREYAIATRSPEAAPIVFVNWGNTLLASQQHERAAMTYREALRRDPDIAGAYLGLGAALEGQVALDSALDAYKQTLVRDASLWRGWEGVGACLLDGQPARPQAAIAALQRAVQGQPRRGRSRCLLARAFAECRQHREVCAAFQRAADLEAPTVETLTRWARSHWSQNDRHRSLELLRQAVALAPDRLVPLRNLATSLLEVYELSAALAAIAPSPRTMLPRCTFAAISSSSGVASMRRSLRCGARAPSPPPTMLLPAASPSPASTAKLSAPPTSLPPSALRVSTGRPRQQPRSLPSANASTSAICPRTSTATPRPAVSRSPRALARSRAFTVTLYHAHERHDATTASFQRRCERWRAVDRASDADFARKIGTDAIDILVDLAGHTAGSRVRVFERRPAPLRVCYLGYPATTGCATTDLLAADEVVCPPAVRSHYTESLLVLPRGVFGPPSLDPALPPTYGGDGGAIAACRPLNKAVWNIPAVSKRPLPALSQQR